MLAEIFHFVRHAPGALALKRRLPQDELYAELIGRADRAGLAERRRALVADLRGDLVEIGCGTGAMFPFYDPGARVIGVEPDAAFASRAREAARGARDPGAIDVREGSGEALPLAAGSMDAAVLALVLCSVPDVGAICREVARVVKPGGAVRLLEHVRSERAIAGALMRAVDPVWCWLNAQGCHLDRDPLPLVEDAGLKIESIKKFQIWSAGLPAFPMRVIHARQSG